MSNTEQNTEKMTLEQFMQLSADEKTKIAGIRFFSDEEIAERAIKSESIVTELIRRFFTDLLAQEKMVLGHLKTDEEKESTLTEPLNNLYYNAVDMGATFEDVMSVQSALFALAKNVDVIKNTYNQDLQKLMFAMIGENYPDSTPMKTLRNLTKSFVESKEPKNETTESNETTDK